MDYYILLFLNIYCYNYILKDMLNKDNLSMALKLNSFIQRNNTLTLKVPTQNTANWFNLDLSNQMNKPILGSFKVSNERINFGNSRFEKEYCKLYAYNNKTDLFNFSKFEENPQKSEITNMKKINTQISNIQETLKESSEKEEKKLTIKLKGLKTKKERLTNASNGITKTNKVQIYPTELQQSIIREWRRESVKCYNKCVDLYNQNNAFFDMGYKLAKIRVFKMLYDDDNKGCPYDVLTDEVRKFCSNLTSCKSNLKNGHIRHFRMKHINTYKDNHTFFIPKTAIKNSSFYRTYLKQMKGMETILNAERDATLTFSISKNKYWLSIPEIHERKIIKGRESVCGIDEGEVYFLSYHGENSFGDIGIYMRKILLKKREKISILQKIIKKETNKNGTKLKNVCKLKKRIQRIYDEIKNLVKELHNKTALFLCKKYDRIMLPQFGTKNMVMNRKHTKSFYQKLKEEKGEEEMKRTLRETTKKKRLNKKVKFVLNMLSHYKFKQHLINKGNEYGCVIDVETNEEETTKTCTICGTQEYTIKGRIRECNICGSKINRDESASRNVVLKNVKQCELKPLDMKPQKIKKKR